MKRIFALIMILCLGLSLVTEALAAKLEITGQPETATTSKKGEVSFSITVKGTPSSCTWYFVNPKTGKKTSGKRLPKKFKGLKVTGANRQKITLKHVPEDMHGWLVYCQIGGGSKVQSDYALLLVYGMEVTEEMTAAVDPLAITKQPKDAKINEEGNAVFSIAYSGLPEKITWAFINPKNGEKVIGKKIINRFKDVTLKGVNGKKLTISNVPEKMVGWKVYAHIKGKGVEFNSETAVILASDPVQSGGE